MPMFAWRSHVVGAIAVDPTQTAEQRQLASDLILSFIALCYNVHDWFHRPSCFKESCMNRKVKKKSSMTCRYVKPHTCSRMICCDRETGEIFARRPQGCEYVNPYSRITMNVFQSNNDIRILATLIKNEDGSDSLSFVNGNLGRLFYYFYY